MEKLPKAQIEAVAQALKYCNILTILNAWNHICRPEKKIYMNTGKNVDKVFDKPSDLFIALNSGKYSLDDFYVTKPLSETQRYSITSLFSGYSFPFDANFLAKHLINHGDSDCPIVKEFLKIELIEWVSKTCSIDQTEVENAIFDLYHKDMGIDPLTENWNDLKEDILWAIEERKK